MKNHSAFRKMTSNLDLDALHSSNLLFYSLISSNGTIWWRKKQEKLENWKSLGLYTGHRPPTVFRLNPYVLSVSFCSEFAKKEAFNPNQTFVTSVSIQETNFKKKKIGGFTSHFCATACGWILVMEGSDFALWIRDLWPQISPSFFWIFKLFLISQ